MRGPATAASYVVDHVSVQMKPTLLKEIVVKIIEDFEWCQAGEDPAELAEKWVGQIKARLVKSLSDAQYEGSAPSYEFSSANDDYIQGSCFVEPKSFSLSR